MSTTMCEKEATIQRLIAQQDGAAKEIERLRSELLYVAEACSHTNDDGGDLRGRWAEHLHEPSPEGGHKFCGPCAAFRALA